MNEIEKNSLSMDIIQTKDIKYKDLIVEQYLRVFSTGQSAQYLDKGKIESYIHSTLIHGYAVLAFENTDLVGSLLTTALKFDKDLPNDIITAFPIENSIYIAELMVEADKRGMGIGRKLIETFYNQIDRNVFSDVFIRVWEENKGALRLYEQSGYKSIATIIQTKTAVDGFTKYEMKKVYLHKRID